jgi:phage replication O-like protein O
VKLKIPHTRAAGKSNRVVGKMKGMAKSYHEQPDPSTSSDGYMKIPHDILETLARADLSSYENRIVMVILHMTLGWHKDADTIANRQFRNATGIKDRGNIHRAVRKLEERRIIVVSRDYRGVVYKDTIRRYQKRN